MQLVMPSESRCRPARSIAATIWVSSGGAIAAQTGARAFSASSPVSLPSRHSISPPGGAGVV
jgi:hypothetical protein